MIPDVANSSMSVCALVDVTGSDARLAARPPVWNRLLLRA